MIFVEGKDTINFKADKNVNFPAQYCLGSLSNGFDATESREVSLKGNIYVFQSITVLLINVTYQIFTNI